jgi:hypothetical protein
VRKLTDEEQEKIKLLTKNQVSLTLIEPTENGLKKSIMDATGSVRSYLKSENIHDYEQLFILVLKSLNQKHHCIVLLQKKETQEFGFIA